MKLRPVNAEVYYAEGGVVQVGAADLAMIKEQAARSPRRRARICTHVSPDDAVHEMLIVLAADVYIRPHKHLGRGESFHVVDGLADVIVFDDAGTVADVVHMGPAGSGLAFFYRMNQSCFHSVVVRSEFFVVHETTRGPFNPADTLFPSWAPAEDDPGATDYAATLRSRLLS